MYYAKQVDENGNVVALHSMDIPFPAEATDFIPITEEEYTVLLTEMMNKTEPTDEISDSEALAIITGGAV